MASPIKNAFKWHCRMWGTHMETFIQLTRYIVQMPNWNLRDRDRGNFSYNSNHIWGLGCLPNCLAKCKPQLERRRKTCHFAHSHHKYFMVLATKNKLFVFCVCFGAFPQASLLSSWATKTAITIRQTECCLHKLSSSRSSSGSTNNNNIVLRHPLPVRRSVCFSFMHKNYCLA